MDDGIAPHCARAAKIRVMMIGNDKQQKVPYRAQERREKKKSEGRKAEDKGNSENGQEDSTKMQKTGKKGKSKKRTNGSARVRKRKQERL
jgi:hypothetical protein